ncbi:hypothetical protein R1080702_080 [Cyanophage S-RIM32]|uniref:Uncharacterized protein n=1 Tax=Cyanophage S-RIM32 TaxID=1278479 RepID=A0A127KMC3_9CAUD|nr:hypothetical protein BJD26_gp176 [Cyanophage S-RIM32]AMO43089.1 hypothetical protein R1080702_080 [Cyanophage S-RIM32]
MNQDFFTQVDKTIKNRERRFKHLMNKDRAQDAIAVAEEFLEWIDPNNVDDIFYINIDELQEMYLEKQHG